MKKLFVLFLLTSLLLGVLVGCSSEGASNENSPNSGSIQARGSDTMVNLGQRWAETYMEDNKDASISITGGGSGTGIAALINGTVDLALSSRAIRDAEIEQAKDNNIEIKEFITGRDGIAVAVNSNNPVQNLTTQDIKDIFTGKKTNWSDFGGNDAEITLYSRESNSGTYVFFREAVLDGEDYASFANLMPSTSSIVEGLKQDENGIGYIGLAYLDEDGIEGINVAKDENSEYAYPSVEAVVSGAYPISRPLFVYSNGEPEGLTKDFIDFIMSEEGQKVVELIGFVPVQ